ADAVARGIADGEEVVVGNDRGECRLRAVVTDGVRPGVVVSPKGRWAKLQGGRCVNWTTPDALADLAGQSTFHSNRVRVRRAGPAKPPPAQDCFRCGGHGPGPSAPTPGTLNTDLCERPADPADPAASTVLARDPGRPVPRPSADPLEHPPRPRAGV